MVEILVSLVSFLLLVIIFQLSGLRRLLETRTPAVGAGEAAPEEFPEVLDETLAAETDEDGWQHLRQQVRHMAEQGMPVPTIARALGLGQGEVLLLLNLDEK